MFNPSTSMPTPSNILLINITKFASEENRDIVRLLGLQVQTLIHLKLGKMSEMLYQKKVSLPNILLLPLNLNFFPSDFVL